MSQATEKATAARRLKAEAGELKQRDPIEHSIADPKSQAKAIKAMCFECVGRNDDPNPRRTVATCTSWGCPLWQVRPWQKFAPDGYGQEKRTEAVHVKVHQSIAASYSDPKCRPKAIKAKCVECMGGFSSIAKCSSVFPNPKPSGYCGCPLWPHRPQPKHRPA
jgi:hypothetical protein